MSIKIKIVLFLTILVLISINVTTFYLSFSKYRPALEAQVVTRIKQAVLQHNFAVLRYMRKVPEAGFPYRFRNVLKKNKEVVYIKVKPLRKGERTMLFSRTLTRLKSGEKTLLMPGIRQNVITEKPVKPKEGRVVRFLTYSSVDYGKSVAAHFAEIHKLNEALNGYLKLKDDTLKQYRIIKKSRDTAAIKKQKTAELLETVNEKVAEIRVFVNRLPLACDKAHYFFELEFGEHLYNLRQVNRKDETAILLYEIYKRLVRSLIQAGETAKAVKEKKMIKDLKSPSRIIEVYAVLVKLKIEINQAMKQVRSLEKRLAGFEFIRPNINEMRAEGPALDKAFKFLRIIMGKRMEFFDTENLLIINQPLRVVVSGGRKKNVAYYEIAISEDAVFYSVMGIIKDSIFSSLLILAGSIGAALLLAFYITYPIARLEQGADEILKDLKYRIRMNRSDEYGKFARTFNHLTDQITEELVKYEKLYQEATEDQLTKLMVRRYFMETLKRELENGCLEKRPTSILMTDIDHFKKFNDTHGHQTGDAVLADVAGVVLKSTRKNRVKRDIAGRYGGEEFSVLMPNTDAEEALALGERIRSAVEKMISKSTKGESLRVTISIGVATSSISAEGSAALIERADKALYQSKESGRNRVTAG